MGDGVVLFVFGIVLIQHCRPSFLAREQGTTPPPRECPTSEVSCYSLNQRGVTPPVIHSVRPETRCLSFFEMLDLPISWVEALTEFEVLFGACRRSCWVCCLFCLAAPPHCVVDAETNRNAINHKNCDSCNKMFSGPGSR